MSFAIQAPVALPPRVATGPTAPTTATEAPQPPAGLSVNAVLVDFLSWIPTIKQGCADEMAHALHLKVYRQ